MLNVLMFWQTSMSEHPVEKILAKIMFVFLFLEPCLNGGRWDKSYFCVLQLLLINA